MLIRQYVTACGSHKSDSMPFFIHAKIWRSLLFGCISDVHVYWLSLPFINGCEKVFGDCSSPSDQYSKQQRTFKTLLQYIFWKWAVNSRLPGDLLYDFGTWLVCQWCSRYRRHPSITLWTVKLCVTSSSAHSSVSKQFLAELYHNLHCPKFWTATIAYFFWKTVVK